MNKKLNFALCATAAVFAVLMLIVSCTQKKDRLVSDTLTIAITPQSVVVNTGASQTYTAVCRSETSNNVDISPQWTVDSPFLGTFSPKSGKTTTFTATNSAMSLGKGKIYATYSNIRASANVTVSSGAASGTIIVSPAAVSLSTGAMQSFTAVCKNLNGTVISVTPQWTVTPASLGTFIPATGSPVTFIAASLATAIGNGTINAACSGFNCGSAAVSVSSTAASGTITISPSSVSLSTGTTQSYTAVCKNSYGAVVNAAPQWSVSPAALGTFSPTTGSSVTFTATSLTGNAGSGAISAACSGFNSGSAAVSVSSNALPGTAGSGSFIIYSDAGWRTNVSLQIWSDGASTCTCTPMNDGNGCTPDPQNYYQFIWDGGTSGWCDWVCDASAKFLDISTYTNLCFYAKGAAGGEYFYVDIKSSNGQSAQVNLDNYIGGGGLSAANWTLVQIPLNQLESNNYGVDKYNIQYIYFSFNPYHSPVPPETVYIDYIYLQ